MSDNITDLGSIKLGSKTVSIENLLKDSAPEADPTPEEEESQEVQDQVQEAIDGLYSSPLEDWKLECESQDLKLSDAAKILDTIMTNGFYEESYRLAGRVFKLRTRTTIDADRLIEMLRELKPDSDAVLSHLVSRINLSSSLSVFADKTFSHTYPADDNREILDSEWRDRWAFVSSLPQPIFLAIAQTMGRFDIRVQLSCDARALENF